MHPQPPRNLLAAYRLTAMRLPEQYRAWAAQDATTTTFLGWRIVRSIGICLLLLGLLTVGQVSKHRLPSTRLLVGGVVVSVVFGLLSSRKTLIRKTLRWQNVDKHGNPVRPASAFVRLGNSQAALLTVVGLILATSASAVVGYGLRPPPSNCADPEPAIAAEIAAAFKTKGSTILAARQTGWERGVVVGAIVKQADKPDAQFVSFLRDGGTLYEVELVSKEQATPAVVTNLPKRTVDVADMAAGERLAVVAGARCLGEAGTRG